MFGMIVIVATLVVVGIAALLDVRRGEIPNWLTLPPLLLAPTAHGFVRGTDGLLFSLLGLVGGALIPYLLFRANAMGGGDVKLFAAIGAFLGLGAGTEIFMASLLVGCVQAVALLMWHRRLFQVLRTAGVMITNLARPARERVVIAPESLTNLRLGPAILLGTLWTVLLA